MMSSDNMTEYSGFTYRQALDNYLKVDDFPARELDMDEQQLLSRFHPDHRCETFTTLNVGPNKGERCHTQLAELLQADSRIDASDLAGVCIEETDVLVIGGGGAGCAAALTAAESGARVILATKLRLGDSNTIMAEGGIQASVQKQDTLQAHYNDTWKAGYKLADKTLVKQLVTDGPETIRWLIQQGMQFDLDSAGDLLTRRAGGTSASRVVHFRDYTGLEMMRVLRESVYNHAAVEVRNYAPAVELLSNESGHCAGAILYDLEDSRYLQIKARSVIIATGGIGRLHLNDFPTSNHFGATGDGLVLAYRLGARLRDLDSFQYHPTGVAYPVHLSGTLITEGLRSAGACIINAQGQRFVDELKPRDIVAAAIIRECREGRGVAEPDFQGVWLDTAGLESRNPGILQQRFPKLVQLGLKSRIDIRKHPMLIYPTLHYQNGGVIIDKNGRSTVPGLYCVGEVSGGIHGRNRLMGNALLEIISFGRKAGADAARQRQNRGHKKITLDHISRLRRELMQNHMPMHIRSPLLFPDYTRTAMADNDPQQPDQPGMSDL